MRFLHFGLGGGGGFACDWQCSTVAVIGCLQAAQNKNHNGWMRCGAMRRATRTTYVPGAREKLKDDNGGNRRSKIVSLSPSQYHKLSQGSDSSFI